jgi:hypothetical protein
MTTPRLTPFSWGRIKDEPDDSTAPKRISTPAGLRLSSIINTDKHIGAESDSPTAPSFASRFSNPAFSPRRLSLNASKRLSGIRVVNEEVLPGGRSPGAISRFKEELQSLKSLKGGPPSPMTPSPEYRGSLMSEKSARLLSSTPSTVPVEQRRKKNTVFRRRIIIGLVIFFLILLAVIIGLAVGLSIKKHKSR